jgi:hypothetical protein
MDRRTVWLTMTTAWILWQEILLPDSSGMPLWRVESQFSGERTCDEGRRVRLIEQILRAGDDGTMIINQPTVQEGTIWREAPNGDRTRIRFFCFPETIDPREPWSSVPPRLTRVDQRPKRS